MDTIVQSDRQKAQDYLREKNVHKLMEKLMTLLVLVQPDNPKQFITQLLSSQDSSTELEKATLNPKQIQRMFSMLECPLDKGYITGFQLRGTLQALGYPADPSINDDQKIKLEEFVSIIQSGQ